MTRANVPHVISDDSALGGQLVSGSLRFRSASNTVLRRTHTSVGNKRTFTFSCWCKRALMGSSHNFLISSSGNGEFFKFGFRDDSRFEINTTFSGSDSAQLISTARFRDRSAWYHIVIAFDTTQATSTNRVKFYVNNTLITDYDTGTYPSQNDQSSVNDNVMHEVGNQRGTTRYFDGYMTEVNMIDGQQLDPTAFGYTESQTGIWRPKKYTGAYGTNGFNLPMNGSSHVGKDMSGNGHDFTPNDCGTVPIDRATGAFPIMNTNSGATIPRPGFRPDPFASNLVLAATFSDPSDTLDVHHLIKGSGSEKGLFVTGATKQESIHNFYGRSGSLYFDGSSDYIDLSATSDFNFGTGDFTIEFWMYSGVNSTDTYYRRLWMTDGPTGNTSGNFQISITPTTGVINLWEDSSALDVSGVSDVTTSTWNHIAAVRSGSTLKLYVNGREEVSTTYTTSISPNSGSPRPRIGNYGAGGGQGDYNGYFQDYRVYKGVAKYTEEFLCGAVDSSITEQSPSGISIPRKLNPSTGGSTGFNMEGASTFLASNSDLTLDGDFTIEFWIYLESLQTDGGSHPTVITFPAEASQGIIGQVYINSSNKYYSLQNSNDGDVGRSAYKSAKVGRWQYITITRSSNSVRLFIDGVLSGNATNSTTYGNQLGVLRLGGYSRNHGMIDGHISNLRIIKGTALYTSDFTPPTEPLTNVSGTSLLCFQSPTDVEDVTVNSNSSTVNNQNWLRTGSYSNTTPGNLVAAFDGDLYTFFGANGNSTAEATYTFPGSGIPFTKLEISGSNYAGLYVKVNGVTFTNWGTTFYNAPYRNVTSVGSPLTSITCKGSGSGQTSTMSAIRINDNTIIAPNFANDYDASESADAASASNFSPFDTDTNIQGPSQYATLNPNAQTGVTLSNGNLTNYGGNDIPSDMGVKTGKFYVEVSIDTANSGSNLKHLGVCATGTRSFRANSSNNHILNNLDYLLIRSDANGPYTTTGRGGITSWTAVTVDTDVGYTLGDTVGIQLDMDNKFVKIYINGVLRTYYTFVLASTFDKMYFYGRNNGAGVTTWNFGQKPYEFTPPPGFLPLASHNLESSTLLKPQKHFEPILYSNGGGSAVNVDTLEFKPDLIWVKARNATADHGLYDSVRGENNRLVSNLSNGESSVPGPVPANSGFSIAGTTYYNPSGSAGAATFVAWSWKAGGGKSGGGGYFKDGVEYASRSDILSGGIASQIGAASINTEAGLSIISFGGTAGSADLPHGLGRVPGWILIKKYSAGGNSWAVYHQSNGAQQQLLLNSTNASSSDSNGFDAVPDANFVHLGSGASMATNQNGQNIAYIWAEIPGYSKFGSFMGSDSTNGPYVDCGFRPSLIIFKNVDTSGTPWVLFDNKRTPHNACLESLEPNTSDPDDTQTSRNIDIYSNGFKIRGNSIAHNKSGDKIIYMAFAEQPEVTPFGSQSNAR